MAADRSVPTRGKTVTQTTAPSAVSSALITTGWPQTPRAQRSPRPVRRVTGRSASPAGPGTGSATGRRIPTSHTICTQPDASGCAGSLGPRPHATDGAGGAGVTYRPSLPAFRPASPLTKVPESTLYGLFDNWLGDRLDHHMWGRHRSSVPHLAAWRRSAAILEQPVLRAHRYIHPWRKGPGRLARRQMRHTGLTSPASTSEPCPVAAGCARVRLPPRLPARAHARLARPPG